MPPEDALGLHVHVTPRKIINTRSFVLPQFQIILSSNFVFSSNKFSRNVFQYCIYLNLCMLIFFQKNLANVRVVSLI